MFQHDARHTGRADVVPQFRVTAESRDNGPTNNIIQPRVRIVNNSGSSVPLSQLTLRYWYTNETKTNAQLFQVYFAQNESNWSSIPATAITSKFTTVARPLADTYMQMGFTSTAGTLANGAAAAVEFNIHAQNWGNYQEANDYSYMSSAARFDWSRVTVYRNGVLVWGTEP
jgi:cellulose 1,4-beta-cellobiosidase